MKVALIFAMVLGFSVLNLSSAEANEKKICKVKTSDIGTIVGRGPSSTDAFEDAASQCFERRAQLYKIKKGHSLDEDSGLVVIDMCANISCG